jgi:uncharacterized protein (TIGR03032 family)
MEPLTPPGQQVAEVIRCELRGEFGAWLAGVGGSVALTTYQAGKVLLVGWDGRQVTLLPRNFDRPMGLDVADRRLVLATRHQLWLLVNSPELAPEFQADQPGRYDALFLPRVSFFTGEVNAHDVAIGTDGPLFVNTRFSCLAAPALDCGFLPRWQPPFITALAPEDRCHLNGLVLEEGRPRFVTALGTTDIPSGWREGRAHGGVVLDVPSGNVLVRGLCMPHSPRLHDGALWVLNSGAGELLRIDRTSFQPEVVCSLPGYVRGLDFVGPYALVGLGTVRGKHLLSGLPVLDRHPRPVCGLAVVDTRGGRVVGVLEFTSGCAELYDVRFLPGVLRPMLVNAEHDAARHGVVAPGQSFWFHPEPDSGDTVVEDR